MVRELEDEESTPRVLCWFSCGDASAVAAKLAVEKYGDRAEVLYCDTFAYEHPDNVRFFNEVQGWLGREIKVLQSPEYTDIYDVFRRTRWLVGINGARCTTELKKKVRMAYQRWDDVHVFGFTSEEAGRIERFHMENPELHAEFPLYDAGVSKLDCHRIVARAGIDLPMMYRMGYKNNNCIGCVKGGAGYWNRIRKDFPAIFNKMASMERELNAAINKTEKGGKRVRMFLDEMSPDAGRYAPEPDIDCGVLCITAPVPGQEPTDDELAASPRRSRGQAGR